MSILAENTCKLMTFNTSLQIGKGIKPKLMYILKCKNI